MTRKSEREIERTLEGMGGGSDDSPVLIVHEDPETGKWYDGDGQPVGDVDGGR